MLHKRAIPHEPDEVQPNVAMLLPDELLHVMFQFSKPDALYKSQCLAEESLVLLEECKALAGPETVGRGKEASKAWWCVAWWCVACGLVRSSLFSVAARSVIPSQEQQQH
jgi:hypothetical protein